ncbi:Serine/threonine-protein kinase GRIK2 [Hibiscus syriacus]|uniref:Serine/threonine-protein kinase GRIK2 n=1 Tax=Hibiscus syriacus TaxID=106335 RepID=A0A6A3CVG8_HIBSY|nr:Serine/threonine-protein kinase GRIK2 [Hibiscus syriacus]
MLTKSFSFAACCGCFGYTTKSKHSEEILSRSDYLDFLLDSEIEEDDGCSYKDNAASTSHVDEVEPRSRAKHSEEILRFRVNNGLICRQFVVKETKKIIPSEDENGNKMVNEYVRQYKIGSGSYAKVVLYQNSVDGKQYAIKAFHKYHLLKLRVAPSETAMNDVLFLEYVKGKYVCEGSGPPGAVGEHTARKYLRDIVSGLMYLHAHV